MDPISAINAATTLIGSIDVAAQTIISLGALLTGNVQDPGESVIVLNFRYLVQQRIKEMQEELTHLAAEKAQILTSSTAITNAGTTNVETINDRVDRLLTSYARAIRNYETLTQEPVDAKLYKSIIRNPADGVHFRELNKKIREATQQRQAWLERIWMGALGGLAIIGPMLLMSLHRDLTTSLITSSVATFLFAIALVFGAPSLKGQEVLGAVAAYAAVLVVFVGSSMTPIS